MKCPKCGRQIADDAERCGWCGLELLQPGATLRAPVREEAEPAPPPPPPQPQAPPPPPVLMVPPPSPITQEPMAPPPATPAPQAPPQRMTPAAAPSATPYVVETPPPPLKPAAPAFKYRGGGRSGGAGKWIGIVLVLAVLGGGGAWAWKSGIIGGTASAPDSAAVAPGADSARADTAPAAAAMGYLRIRGDLPEDAIIWIDGDQKPRGIVALAPGAYNLEIETSEFQPWERTITIAAGDTLRILVELELLPQDTTDTGSP